MGEGLELCNKISSVSKALDFPICHNQVLQFVIKQNTEETQDYLHSHLR